MLDVPRNPVMNPGIIMPTLVPEKFRTVVIILFFPIEGSARWRNNTKLT